MSKTLSLIPMAIALAIPAFAATTYYVNDATGDDNNGGTSPDAALKTIAKGVSKAVAGDVVEVAAGTYTITSEIAVSKAITIHGANRATTIIDANNACRIFNVSAAATIESFTLYRGRGSASRSGSGAYFTKAGTLRDCLVNSCSSPTGGGAVNGVGVYLSGGAVAENCIISNTWVSINATLKGIGVYIDNGALRDSLVTRSRRTGYDIADTGAVYLKMGTVERCTIAGNTVGYSGGLYVNNAANCIVRDTIVWGNTTTRDSSRLRPNMNAVGSNCVLENVCTSGNVGTGGVDANPCFRDAANWDFALLPGSPCIGAGTNGRDLGYLQHDSTADALGISISAYRGRGSLEVTAKLSASGAYSLAGATVTWDGLTETGTTITHTFGYGTHSLTANVTFADSSTATITLPNAVKVTVGEVYVDDDSENPVPPYTTPETAAKTLAAAFTYLDDTNAVVYVAEGTYSISSQLILTSGRKVVATGSRDQTILQKSADGVRFFYVCGTGAEISGLTLDGRNWASGSVGGAIWMTSSGTISNCVVRNCKSSTNANGGGLYLSSGTITHSIVKNCMGSTYAKGAGVYLEGGAVIRDSVVANCGNSGKRTSTSNLGGGVYLTGTGTKALNCTVVNNTSCLGGGIYVDGTGPIVANCIIYGNDEGGSASTGSPDWYGTASRFVNCCAKVAPNGTGVAVSSSPVAADFTIDATTGADCINGGDNSYVVTTADLFGNPRIVNGTVDIGAAEYASVEVVPGFQADVLRGLAPLQVVFSGTVQGIDPEGAVFSWYFDGSETPAGTGQTFTNTFGVGYHTVQTVISKDGSDYATDWSAANYILALPQHMFVATNAASAFPYDTPETASTNIHTVVDLAREADGITITVGPGRYALKKTLMIDKARTTLAGAGMEETILYHPQGIGLLSVNALGSLVSDLCLSNGTGRAGGLDIHGSGGHVTRCLITNCNGPVNNPGGGADINSSGARLSRSIIRNCAADTTNAGSQSPFGAGLLLESGRVEDCLIIGNQAEAGAGAYVTGGTLANCVVTGNKAWNKSGTRTFCAGGVYATGGNVLNCIVFGNSTNGGTEFNTSVANVSGIGSFSHCCLPSVFAGQGTATVATADPQFKNPAAGDYRIRSTSPCRDKGLYQSWMADAVDFFGNPRARGAKVDIGYHQSEPTATAIFLK